MLRAVAHSHIQQQPAVACCCCAAGCYLLLQAGWQQLKLAHEVQPHAVALQLWQLLLQRGLEEVHEEGDL